MREAPVAILKAREPGEDVGGLVPRLEVAGEPVLGRHRHRHHQPTVQDALVGRDRLQLGHHAGRRRAMLRVPGDLPPHQEAQREHAVEG